MITRELSIRVFREHQTRYKREYRFETSTRQIDVIQEVEYGEPATYPRVPCSYNCRIGVCDLSREAAPNRAVTEATLSAVVYKYACWYAELTCPYLESWLNLFVPVHHVRNSRIKVKR